MIWEILDKIHEYPLRSAMEEFFEYCKLPPIVGTYFYWLLVVVLLGVPIGLIIGLYGWVFSGNSNFMWAVLVVPYMLYKAFPFAIVAIIIGFLVAMFRSS